MSTVSSVMGAVWRSAPSGLATVEEVAAWYERKAELFERVAAEPGARVAEAERAAVVARESREHARWLRQNAADSGSSPAA